MVYVALALAVVAGTVVLWLVTRSITRPLRRTVAVLQSVADGHLDARIEEERKDEIGQLGVALNGAVGNLGHAIAEIAGTANELAAASEELSAVSSQMTNYAAESAAQAGVVSTAAGQVSLMQVLVSGFTYVRREPARQCPHQLFAPMCVSRRPTSSRRDTAIAVTRGRR